MAEEVREMDEGGDSGSRGTGLGRAVASSRREVRADEGL
jgi:hypothetical protein